MKKIVVLASIVLAMNSCQNQESASNAHVGTPLPDMEQSVLADSVSAASKMSVAALQKTAATPSVSTVSKAISDKGNALPERKIIRTAYVKTQVNNTEQATYKIEQTAKKYAGFISSNNLESRVTSENDTPVSADSVLNTKAYQVANRLVVRVPNQYLDTFLYEISAFYTFLDHRNINDEDVTATFLSNTLKAEVREKAAKQLHSVGNGKGADLDDIATVQNAIVDMKDEAIEKQIENLEVNYKIQYSQVNLEIYQPDVVIRAMKLNPSVLNPSPSFGYRLVEALKSGGAVLVDIFIMIVNAWAVILLALAAWWIYRKYGHQIGTRFSKATSRHI